MLSGPTAPRGARARTVTRVAVPAALVLLLLAHLALGHGATPAALWSGDEQALRILWELRVPRTATAVFAGAALGLSGLLLQALLRNPLASPEMTAVNPAAVLAALTASGLGLIEATDVRAVTTAALVGGLAGGSLMWWAARDRSPSESAVLGLLAALALTGGTTLVLTARPTGLAGALRWLIGSLDGAVLDSLVLLVPVVLVAAALLAVCAVPLEILAVGERHAQAVGVAPRAWRLAGLGMATVLAAVAVAVTGPLAFVGFLAPHLARGLRPGRMILLVPLVALLGAGFVVACDALAVAFGLLLRSSGAGQQVGLPTGALSCVLGAPALIRAARHVPPGELE